MPRLSQFKTREEYNEWYRQYRAKNRDKFRVYQREYNRLYRKKHGYKSNNKWKKNNKIKVKVERLVHYAIKKGLLKRLPCYICGKEKGVAHHPDYKKPLEVIFLCHIHHRQLHYRKNKKVNLLITKDKL